LFIGRSQNESDPTLNALIRDFRIYSIALTDQQVATIRNNGLRGVEPATPVAETSAQTNQPVKSGGIAQPMASKLTAVPDINVDTIVGNLPRLPYTVPAVYRDNAKGPAVRVIWPSPTNNQQTLQPGTYTVTGSVAGTTFKRFRNVSWRRFRWKA
jgi:hypothetical protein